LKLENNGEPWEFIREVTNLKNAKNPAEEVQKIIKTFIEKNAPKEINLSNQNKTELMEVLKDQLKESFFWIAKKTPEEIFADTIKIIKLELFMDNYPRFIRTKECLKVLQKFLKDAEVIVFKEAIDFPYSDKSFREHWVSDQDIQFLRLLAKDNFDWELIGSITNNLNTFFSYRNYMPQVSYFKNASIGKFELIMPYSLEKVICAFCPTYEIQKVDGNVQSIHNHGYISCDDLKKKGYKMNKDRSVSLMGVDLKFPFPLRTYRKLPSVVACDYDPVHQIFNFIHKSSPDFSKGVDMETFDWHKKVKGSIIVDKTDKEEKDKTSKDKWTENGSVHFMLDLATYQIQKN